MSKESPLRYFVSANSGNGFYSLYDNVFQNERFDRIFIIHGGPGTGKSTLMRALCKQAFDNGAQTEEILCSSDPESLDGAILSHGEKRIAVLDGTLPHARIISTPGAKEELWNLGAFWDTDILARNSAQIKELQENKRKSYREAYALLSAAECCHREAYLRRLDMLNAPKLTSHTERLVKRFSLIGEREKRFFRAYSMKGEYIEPSICKHSKNIVLLCGKLSSAQIYLSHFARQLQLKNIAHTLFLSPLSPSLIDAIAIKENSALFVWDGFTPKTMQARRVHLERFFDAGNGGKQKERSLLSLEKSLTNTALFSLEEAKKAHFSLEAIYGSAMNFDAMKKESSAWVENAASLLAKNT